MNTGIMFQAKKKRGKADRDGTYFDTKEEGERHCKGDDYNRNYC